MLVSCVEKQREAEIQGSAVDIEALDFEPEDDDLMDEEGAPDAETSLPSPPSSPPKRPRVVNSDKIPMPAVTLASLTLTLSPSRVALALKDVSNPFALLPLRVRVLSFYFIL